MLDKLQVVPDTAISALGFEDFLQELLSRKLKLDAAEAEAAYVLRLASMVRPDG